MLEEIESQLELVVHKAVYGEDAAGPVPEYTRDPVAAMRLWVALPFKGKRIDTLLVKRKVEFRAELWRTHSMKDRIVKRYNPRTGYYRKMKSPSIVAESTADTLPMAVALAAYKAYKTDGKKPPKPRKSRW